MLLSEFVEEAGHSVVGTAMSSQEAVEAASALRADLAFVDVHLADGPTGIDVGRFIVDRTETAVVFMTANPKRIPDDLSGAIGVIAKPYSYIGLSAALQYLQGALLDPPPRALLPRSLLLAPSYTKIWQ